MSPTSYQTAPPRSSIIINAYDIVKLTPSIASSTPLSRTSAVSTTTAHHKDAFSSIRTSVVNPHPIAVSWHRTCVEFSRTKIPNPPHQGEDIYGQERFKRES